MILSFLLLTAFVVADKNWKTSRYPLQMDANGYYIYLPAIFIYDDLKTLDFVNKMPAQFDRKYFLYEGINGGFMTKYTPGMAILELPFFLVGHLFAPMFGFEQSGYSPPYRLAVAISSIFYSCLALWILSVVLARYFSKDVVLVTVAALLLGTNILFYSVFQPAITHNYVLFALCAMLYFIDRWNINEKPLDFALACACVGFCALIRPTEILTGLVPIGFLVNKWKQQKFQFAWISRHYLTFLIGLILFTVFLFPVFMYWKYATGNWIAYTYEQEGFYFDRPWQIWLGLFGARKGWFIYSPIIFLAVWGLYRMWSNQKFSGIVSSVLWYLPFNIYIVLSWYGWWYGGCFGMRALIPSLALMAFPIAFIVQEAVREKVFLTFFISFCILLNLFQTIQYQRQVLHMDAMTWKAYFYIFGKWSLTKEEIAKRNKMLDYPDYSQRGKKLDEYFK